MQLFNPLFWLFEAVAFLARLPLFIAQKSGVDTEQYEAAVMDGANGFQQLIYITLPSIAPTIGLMFIFTIAHLVTKSTNNKEVQVKLEASFGSPLPLYLG